MFPPPVSAQGRGDIMLTIKKRFANKPKVAIAGFGKAGKSSLRHAIYGENVATVSPGKIHEISLTRKAYLCIVR